jgi:hypothetical protein
VVEAAIADRRSVLAGDHRLCLRSLSILRSTGPNCGGLTLARTLSGRQCGRRRGALADPDLLPETPGYIAELDASGPCRRYQREVARHHRRHSPPNHQVDMDQILIPSGPLQLQRPVSLHADGCPQRPRGRG